MSARIFAEGERGLVRPAAFAALLLLVGATAFLGVPQSLSALLLAMPVLAAVAIHPLNGVALLLLVVPFFLDVGSRPWFFLIEGLALTTVVSGILNAWRGGFLVPPPSPGGCFSCWRSAPPPSPSTLR